MLASARNVVDGGSLTVIATASAPLGGETTVIALDARAAAAGRFPALDVAGTGTLRPERLVGDDGAEAIARMRVAGARELASGSIPEPCDRREGVHNASNPAPAIGPCRVEHRIRAPHGTPPIRGRI